MAYAKQGCVNANTLQRSCKLASAAAAGHSPPIGGSRPPVLRLACGPRGDILGAEIPGFGWSIEREAVVQGVNVDRAPGAIPIAPQAINATCVDPDKRLL
jgi:hypothetical protein